MSGYRLTYAIALTTAFAFFVVYRPWFSWYLLFVLILLIPADFLISFKGMQAKAAKISAPDFLEKDSNGALTIKVINKKPFPIRCLYVKMIVVGDDFISACNVQCPAGTPGRCDVKIDTSKTGLTTFKINSVYAVSLIGLFAKKIKTISNISVLILPPAKKPANTLQLPRGLIMKPKPGGGFSEEHEMRVYQQGDPIRSIHWKLSAKHGTLIIREPLIPLQQSRLVHIMKWDNAEMRDNILSHLRWICDYLIKKELTFYVKFADRPQYQEITAQEDLIKFLHNVLNYNVIQKTAASPRTTGFSWVYKVTGESGVSHDEASEIIDMTGETIN